MDEQLQERMLERERVANIRKHWVRLVTACNSRCLFCLDTDTPRNVYIPDDDVRREIKRGRDELGATKAILSGGEGSLHPQFVDFVRYAREIGYTRVQTVTNGMMLSQRDFFLRAVEAGLDEITYSLHGHTPELHDHLTGTPGAFKKIMKSMIRAVRDGRVIVNGDVCSNKQNVAFLDQIVELCLSVGVREFDLLHVIPQGAAFENREQLFYDPLPYLPVLHKVFRLNRHPGVVVWTNRFPVDFLEGLEDLIQDPHKMIDEVNGRRFQVMRYLDEGVPLECREKERCQYCFIEPFCNTADRVIRRQNRAEFDVWHLGAVGDAERAGLAQWTLDDMPYGSRWLGVEVDDLAELEPWQVPEAIGLYARVRRVSRLPERAALRNPLTVVVSDVESLAAAFAAAWPAQGFELEVELNQSTAPWLLENRALLAERLTSLRIHQPSYELLKDTVANDVRDPKQFFVQLALPVRVSGLPACLVPGTRLVEAPKVLYRRMFNLESGRLDWRELAREHVTHGYWGKSLRCRDCRLSERCDGAHINFLRDQGLKQLEPLREGEWAEEAERQMLRLRPEPPPRLRDGKPIELVAPSLPGYAPPQPAPVEPLMEQAERARRLRELAREQRRMEARERAIES